MSHEYKNSVSCIFALCEESKQAHSPPSTHHSYTGVACAEAAASAGAECAGFSARCPRRVHATAVQQALLRARDVWDACAALKRRDLAIGARAGAQRIGAPRRGGRRGARGGVGQARTGRLRERPSRRGGGLSAARAARRAALLRRRQPLFRAGAWRRAAAGVAGAVAAQRASAGSESGRHVEEGGWGGCRRLVWLEARLRCAALSLRSGAWRRAAASVAGSFGGAAFIPPTRARPPDRPPALRPCPFAGAGALAGEHLLPLLARLLPCPVARRALARPPHRARSARLLAAAAARPAPPRLPPS